MRSGELPLWELRWAYIYGSWAFPFVLRGKVVGAEAQA